MNITSVKVPANVSRLAVVTFGNVRKGISDADLVFQAYVATGIAPKDGKWDLNRYGSDATVTIERDVFKYLARL